MIESIHHQGPHPGPHILLLGGVHGDECPGYLALDALAERFARGQLELVAGQVTIIPRVNAQAVALGQHYIDENLNRLITRHVNPDTHEKKLANALIPFLDAADVVLDIHGTTAPTAPFVFLDDEGAPCRAWAQSLGVSYMLAGWPALYEAGPDVSTTEYAMRQGKLALTVEAGQMADSAAASIGLSCARATLSHFGLVPDQSLASATPLLRLTHVEYFGGQGFLSRQWSNCDRLSAGDLLAQYDDGRRLVAEQDGYIIMPRPQSKPGEEWYYLAVEE